MCLIGFLLPFHNIKCAGGYTFLKSLISFVNFLGAFSCFLVTSPVSKTFAYLGLVLRRITPSESACFQLDFSIIFDRKKQVFSWKTLTVSGYRYVAILVFLVV